MSSNVNRIIVSALAALFVAAGNSRCAARDPAGGPVVDSAMTRKEALDGVNPACPEDILNNQTLLGVTYYSLDGLVHQGQIVVDRRLAGDVARVFEAALGEGFPFAGVIPVGAFGWNDEASMAANNTSGFNYREATGGKKLSNHAHGFALDINPLFNPYIKEETTLPEGAVYSPGKPGTLTADNVVVRTFLKLGWEWGGNWQSLKDYQHFEKVPAE